MNTLKLEGERYGIRVNTVAPLALTRLTEGLMPEEMKGRLKAEAVAPLVMVLCSEQCPESGLILNAGMGRYSRAAVVSGPGVILGAEGQVPSAEDVWREWAGIHSVAGGREYHDANEALGGMLG
jgi:NAD(P)-dependent dehydrogenase (short-subunit alcohol dehydrogenase family)